MMKLLSIESKKILPYKTFWIIIGLYFVFLALGIIMAEYMVNSMVNDINKRMPIPLPHAALYHFPDIWQNLTFFASIRYVLIFPAIIIIILITNEFANKTIRQNVINGMSKGEILGSKLLIIFILSIIITVILGIVIYSLGIANTDMESFGMGFQRITFLLGFFIMMVTFLCIAFFFGFLLRNTGLAIALFALYTLIIEPILYFLLKAPFMPENKIYTYLPVNSVIRIVEYPSIPSLVKIMNFQVQDHVSLISCLIPIAYSIVMIGIVYLVMHRKDL